MKRSIWRPAQLVAAGAACCAILAVGGHASAGTPQVAPPDIANEGPIVRSTHQVRIGGRVYRYVAQAGRLAIRDVQTGEAHGYMFYTAYRLDTDADTGRPIAFLWGGGPGEGSVGMNVGYFGPQRIRDGHLVDNPDSLLPVADLVFVDAVGTGFSRPAKPQYADEFFNTRGDAAAMAEFVRVWLDLYTDQTRPVYVGGASYGTWRAGGVAQLLNETGVRVSGAILLSGGTLVGNVLSPAELIGARVPGEAAAAFTHGKLSPELGTSLAQVVATATAWARTEYISALERVDALSADEREHIAAQLSQHTGYPLEMIDRKTLTFTQPHFREGLLAAQGEALDVLDMRRTSALEDPPAEGRLKVRYLRDQIGYRTDLAYVGLDDLETGYSPIPGPEYQYPGALWNYNSGGGAETPQMAIALGLGPPGSEPWMLRSIALNPDMRVFVGAGLFDSMNSCMANDLVKSRLPPAAAHAFTMHCYVGGHRMAVDEKVLAKMSADVRAFLSTGG